MISGAQMNYKYLEALAIDERYWEELHAKFATNMESSILCYFFCVIRITLSHGFSLHSNLLEQDILSI
jgi:hypothetical protein